MPTTMLARHAESLYWAGRYLERAEDTARMLEVVYYDALSQPAWVSGVRWRSLLRALRVQDQFADTGQDVSDLAVTRFLVSARGNPGSIVNCIASARENLRVVRERLPNELWEAANRFHLHLSSLPLDDDVAEAASEVFVLVKRRTQEVAGVVTQSMTRDECYRFLVLGRMNERGLMTCRLLTVKLSGAAEEDDDWLVVLSAVAGLEAFVRLGRSVDDDGAAVAFLLQSVTFPRSVLFALEAIDRDLDALGGEHVELDRLVGATRSRLEFTDLHRTTETLEATLARLEGSLRDIADLTASTFFEAGGREIRPLSATPVATDVRGGRS